MCVCFYLPQLFYAEKKKQSERRREAREALDCEKPDENADDEVELFLAHVFGFFFIILLCTVESFLISPPPRFFFRGDKETTPQSVLSFLGTIPFFRK